MARHKIPPDFRDYLAKIGKKGGLKGGPARAAKMTQEERSESARNAVRARWAKAKPKERSEIGRKAVNARWAKEKQAV